MRFWKGIGAVPDLSAARSSMSRLHRHAVTASAWDTQFEPGQSVIVTVNFPIKQTRTEKWLPQAACSEAGGQLLAKLPHGATPGRDRCQDLGL